MLPGAVLPPEAVAEKSVPCLFQRLMGAGIPWCSLPCDHITVISVSIVMSPPPLCLCYLPPPLSFKDVCDGT